MWLISCVNHLLMWATSDMDLMWLLKLCVPVFILCTYSSVRGEQGLLEELCCLCRSTMLQPQIARHANSIHCPSSHIAEAAFKCANRWYSLAGNINECLGSSAGAAQPLILTAWLCRNETALCNSHGSESFWGCLCVLTLPDSFTLQFFYKLNNQDKATSPFLQGISFLLRSFHSASCTSSLFAGTKDVIPLRFSKDPHMTGSW